MNKPLGGAGAAFVLLLLAAPGLVGSITEARVRERVAAIDAGEALTAEVLSYERGWFASHARIELGLAPGAMAGTAALAALAGADPSNRRAVVVVNFAHGPLALRHGLHAGWGTFVARLDPDFAAVAELEQNLGIPYAFEFRGRTGFFGATEFAADVPRIDLPVDELTLAFSGATLVGRIAGDALVAQAHVAAIEFSSPTGSFAISGIRASADNRVVSDYVLPGRASFAIDSVAIVDATRGTAPVFEAKALAIATDAALHEADTLLDFTMTYGLDSLRFDTTTVTGAALGIALRNVDVAAVQAYSAATRAAAAAGSGARSLVAALGPHFERALAAGPNLTLEPIRFNVAADSFDGRIELAADTARLPTAGRIDFENPLGLLGLVRSAAELRLSKPLAQRLVALASTRQFAGASTPEEARFLAEAQAGLLLTTLLGQGMLVDDTDAYRATVSLRDGRLTVNGNPLPFGF